MRRRELRTFCRIVAGCNNGSAVILGVALLCTLMGCKDDYPLHRAAAYGDMVMLRDLLADGADPNVTDEDGDTPLHAAAVGGQVLAAELLLASGVNVNARNHSNDTPLHYAATVQSRGSVACGEFLIANGADVNAVSGDKDTALYLAARRNSPRLVHALVTAGANVDLKGTWGTPMRVAVMWNRPEIVKVLLEADTKIHAEEVPPYTDILDLAAEMKKTAIVEILLDSIDVRAAAKSGRTRLHHASIYGQIGVARGLLERGAEINAKDRRGETPLDYAVWGDEEEMAEFLRSYGGVQEAAVDDCPRFASEADMLREVEKRLAEGGDIDDKDISGNTALHKAAQAGHLELTRFLVEKGADINPYGNNRNFTPLHLAVLYRRSAVARLLIESGAVLDRADRDGKLPLHWASMDNQQELVELMLNRGADVNYDGGAGTALVLVAGSDLLEMARLLIDRGATVNTSNEGVESPLHQAVRNLRLPMARLLVAAGADVNAREPLGIPPLVCVPPGKEDTDAMVELLRQHGAKTLGVKRLR